MILSDTDIKQEMSLGYLFIKPFNLECLQPASYDFHLHEDILIPDYVGGDVVTPDETDGTKFWRKAQLPRVMYPNDVLLGRSIEEWGFPPGLVGRLEGVSTLGRWFLQVHVTAGFFDPGFSGTATLEIKNAGPFKIQLTQGMRIGHMIIETTKSHSTRLYGRGRNRYQYQKEPTASRRSPSPA